MLRQLVPAVLADRDGAGGLHGDALDGLDDAGHGYGRAVAAGGDAAVRLDAGLALGYLLAGEGVERGLGAKPVGFLRSPCSD